MIHLQQLAAEAVAMAEAATAGPWHVEDWYSFCDADGCEVGDVRLPAHRTEEEDRGNAAFIAHARTSLPILAKAVLRLMPYVNHTDGCSSFTTDRGDPETRFLPCDCGLDAAISEIGGAGGAQGR